MRRLYSERYDDRWKQKEIDRENGEGRYDKFGNPDVSKESETGEDYSSHSSDERGSDGEESSEASSFDSEASRINFWRDINTKDEEYTNAVIVSNDKTDLDSKAAEPDALTAIKNRLD